MYDVAIYAFMHDGARASHVALGRRGAFAHNDVCALREECAALRGRTASVSVVVECVYSMDGSVTPLCVTLDTINAVFLAGNAHMAVHEIYVTGLYGRGLIALLGVEKRVLGPLHMFGKALAASGGAYSIFLGYDKD